ncbi:MAG TPA: hypothetical protein VFE62_03660 [Gemmataceae bacterium]|nr:hypothetical protein [Gemmataceae bacterium]
MEDWNVVVSTRDGTCNDAAKLMRSFGHVHRTGLSNDLLMKVDKVGPTHQLKSTKLRVILCLVFVVCAAFANAQEATRPELKLDPARKSMLAKHALQTPAQAERSYHDLAVYLAKPARGDLKKTQTFSSYTVSHLRSPKEKELWSSEPLELLGKTRVASCAGYSEVMRGLCLAGGVKAVYIRGHSRTNWEPRKKIKVDEPDHSWNAVLIAGEWHLLDATWGVFLTPADIFVCRHLPVAATRHNIHIFPKLPQSEWQLLKHPITAKAWEELPKMNRLPVKTETDNKSKRQPDILFEDFESGYRHWNVYGKAFGAAPPHGTLPDQQPVSGYYGKALVNSYLGGDKSTGRLISRPFKIERDYIRFVVGGGSGPRTQIRLFVEGNLRRVAAGYNNEELFPHAWNVRDLRGRDAHIEIVDNAIGSWGHINVDHIEFSDEPISTSSVLPSGRIVP